MKCAFELRRIAPRLQLIVSLVAFTGCCTPAYAQLPERFAGALQRIYGDNWYAAETIVQMRWLEDGNRYSVLTPDGEIIAYDTATGRQETLLSRSDLTPPGGGPLRPASYAISTDASKALVFTNTVRVWRQNTRGDYWVFDRQSRLLRKLGGDAPPSSLMFAKLSPDASRVAYVRSNDVYVEDVQSARITRLTTDGGEDVINGTSDWVNEEELFLRDGFRWSPDGRFIAFWQFDTSGVSRFTLINNTASLYPTVKQFPYPKAGTTNSSVRIGIAAADGGPTLWIPVPGDPREYYIPRMDWVDAVTVAFNRTPRRQNSSELMLADARTGTVRRVYGEQSNTWIDSADPLVMDDVRPVFWINKGREFTWISDKDGWRHVYGITRDDGRERLLTRFEGDAMRIVSLDERANRLYFVAAPENATQRYLFGADLLNGAVRRVTPNNVPGTHAYAVSPDGKWALDTYSRADAPPRTLLISLPDHTVVRELVSNQPLAQRVAPLLRQPTEFFQVTVSGGVRLDGMIIKPSSFDPGRKYPLIVIAYTEPGSTTVDDRWIGPAGLFRRALADEGYVVASFENRGTPVAKGRAWRKVVYGSLGDLASKEQAEAVIAFASERTYIDLDRVGIYGASGGGSATLNALFRFPQLYKVGVSIAPAADQLLYDTIYQERYMGLPQENAAGYRNGSAINFAEGLQGHPLVIHGTGDDNVHIQGTERLVDRLIELGKDFDLMVYPNRTHALSEGESTTVHLWRTVARYFFQHLPPSP